MTYIYECADGHVFEAQQRITDEPLVECYELLTDVECRKIDGAFNRQSDGDWKCHAPCSRVIQPVGFSLKGGGWASEGYNKKGS